MNPNGQKHQQQLPTARKVRRACQNELYRTAKRLKHWVPKDKMEAAAELYFKKVLANMAWIVEHQNNRRKQADWWEEHVAPEIAELWDIDRERLCEAFRDAYGG
ncbi:dehydrogenase [Paenibacillus sp. J5C_2022]|uniref:dehydrogenase n=1 Tax=Paenibacillus sp. J5C2022 TaxID=2977129 RepID=UPI0021D3CBCE|nr:dehydrogenase [Paenibacillus sp. J5C2022]MCU6709210.1 dehydrogenase [Paenibacillus sp. J5C2022]